MSAPYKCHKSFTRFYVFLAHNLYTHYVHTYKWFCWTEVRRLHKWNVNSNERISDRFLASKRTSIYQKRLAWVWVCRMHLSGCRPSCALHVVDFARTPSRSFHASEKWRWQIYFVSVNSSRSSKTLFVENCAARSCVDSNCVAFSLTKIAYLKDMLAAIDSILGKK